MTSLGQHRSGQLGRGAAGQPERIPSITPPARGRWTALNIGLSKELAPKNIRVNAIRPGLIETEIHRPGGILTGAQRLASGRVLLAAPDRPRRWRGDPVAGGRTIQLCHRHQCRSDRRTLTKPGAHHLAGHERAGTVSVPPAISAIDPADWDGCGRRRTLYQPPLPVRA